MTKNQTSKIKKLEERWDNMDRWAKRILGAVATIGTIIGIIGGMTSWVIGQVDLILEAKLAPLEQEIITLQEHSDEGDKKQVLNITRLELTNLIAHNAENVVEIERVARYYFVDLGGDWYMSKIYSDWAKEYGGDISFVLHK